MKKSILKIYILLTLLLSYYSVSAQNESYQTVFSKNGFSKISGFGSILNELSVSRNSKIGTFYSVGLEGALLINQRFYFGLFGMSSVAPYDIYKGNDFSNALMFVQMGTTMGYKFQPNRAIHFTVGLRTGYGHLQQIEQWRDWNRDNNFNFRDYPYASSFIVSPHINVEANFFPWMKANVGVGYRFAFGGGDFGIDPSNDLSMPIAQLGFSFGWFRPKNQVSGRKRF